MNTIFKDLNNLASRWKWSKSILGNVVRAYKEGRQVVIIATLDAEGVWWSTELDTPNDFNTGGSHCDQLIEPKHNIANSKNAVETYASKWAAGRRLPSRAVNAETVVKLLVSSFGKYNIDVFISE